MSKRMCYNLKSIIYLINKTQNEIIRVAHLSKAEMQFVLYLEKLNYVKVSIEKTFNLPIKIEKLRPIKPEDLNMKSNWTVLKDYINSKEIGSIINRRDYRNEIELFLTTSSFDRYCKNLSQLFILEDLDKGTYKILKKVPDNMNTQQLFRLLNDDTWRRWFMPLEDRLAALN